MTEPESTQARESMLRLFRRCLASVLGMRRTFREDVDPMNLAHLAALMTVGPEPDEIEEELIEAMGRELDDAYTDDASDTVFAKYDIDMLSQTRTLTLVLVGHEILASLISCEESGQHSTDALHRAAHYALAATEESERHMKPLRGVHTGYSMWLLCRNFVLNHEDASLVSGLDEDEDAGGADVGEEPAR